MANKLGCQGNVYQNSSIELCIPCPRLENHSNSKSDESSDLSLAQKSTKLRNDRPRNRFANGSSLFLLRGENSGRAAKLTRKLGVTISEKIETSR